MFKKGDYLVYLNKDDSKWLKYNHCYIHNGKISNYFYTDKCNQNEITSNTKVTFLSDLWRYATPEEITEYDRLGKPYDVTILQKEETVQKYNSIPEYVECVNSKNDNEFTIGKIYQVRNGKLTTNSGYYCQENLYPNLKDYYYKYDFKSSTESEYLKQQYPLTPKECISNNDIIEVGDEVEIIKNGNGNFSSNSIGYRFIVREIYTRLNTYLREFKGELTGVDISYCKLIKKASQTTNYIHEKQVIKQPKNVPQTTTLLRFEPEDELLIDTSVRQIKSIKQELIELN